MLHGRNDYAAIQDPRENGIGKDEPVMLFRAQDALAPLALDAYAKLIRDRTDDTELAAQVEKQAKRMRDWQTENGKQFPDVYPHHYLVDEADAVEVDSGPVQPVGTAPGNSEGPASTGPPKKDGHWPEVIPPGEKPEKEDQENPTAIPEGAGPAEGVGVPTRDVPESELDAPENAGLTDELETKVHPAGDEPSDAEAINETMDDPVRGPNPNVADDETGPLSDAGSDLMGGQPTEHGTET